MRNLKKFLALVLAMVMAFSLMLTASAVDYDDYQDKDQITAEFEEAVQVLTGLKVFQGDEKGFRPGSTITRAEVAAIIYRIATGDVEDKQVKIYADYSNFTDVKSDDWFAGYVGYCHNAQYIKGESATRFNPYGNVTGYEALAMILRAVGYDQNHEFEGASWQVHVASLSKNLGVTSNVENSNFDTTLNRAVTREVVADLLFQTAATVPTVTYTPALGYNDRDKVIDGDKNPNLGFKVFGLRHTNGWIEDGVDSWGRPGYYWYTNKTAARWYASGSNKNVIATIMAKPTLEYTDVKLECDVAHELDFDGSRDFRLYVNDDNVTASAYHVVATDTVTKAGGQGRKTEFYYNVTSKFAGDLPNWCVMVDTFLAKVVGVKAPVLDAAGHVITPATLTLDAYDKAQTEDAAKAEKLVPNPTRITVSKPSNSTESWEYSLGDYILLNAHTDKTQRDFVVDADTNPATIDWTNTTGLNHSESIQGLDAANRAAFEPNRIKTAMMTGAANKLKTDLSLTTADSVVTEAQKATVYSTAAEHAEVLQKAGVELGKQTKIYWNQGKHNMGDKDYMDQLDLFLDQAGSNTSTTWAWYFDQYGNLIGIAEAPNTTRFGVIKSIYSSFNTADGATDGTAVAVANVLFSDGTEEKITIDRFLVSNYNGTNWGGHATPGSKLDATTVNTDQSAELVPTYDWNPTAGANTDGATMRATTRGKGSTNAVDALRAGWLHVAPVASVNAAAENNRNTAHGGYYGIILGNMFKFVNSADDKLTAIEVAGAASNDGVYKNLRNALTGDAENAKLSKNYAYLSVNGNTIRMDNNTDIVVRASATSTSVKVYDGIADLPANIDVANSSEVDWADVDGNGIADVVYVIGTAENAITYGLFYFNGDAGEWTGDRNGSGWLRGYLDGVAKDLPFADRDVYDLVQQSTNVYGGHLFAVKMEDGEVTELFGEKNVTYNAANDHLERFLGQATDSSRSQGAVALEDLDVADTKDVTVNDGITDTKNTTKAFVCGILGGNSYTYDGDGDTTAIWYQDVTGSATEIRWNESQSRIEVWNNGSYSTSYPVTGNTSTNGQLFEYLNRADYTNDVTIVYQADYSSTAIQVYVTTRPDITGPGADNTVTYTMNIVGERFVVTHRVGGNAAVISTTVDTYLPYRVYLSNGTRVPYDALGNGGSFAIAANQSSGGFGLTGLSSGYYYIEVDAEGQTWTSPVFFK